MSGPTIRVPNWSDLQHYKDRSPPWIKLHRKLLDNRQWHALSGDAAKLLVELWLVASDSPDGIIGFGTEDLAWKRRREPGSVATLLVELEAAGFLDLSVHDASTMLAPCSPEGERETEKRQRRVRRNFSDEFTALWKTHPRGSKAKAWEEYQKAVPDRIEHAQLLACYERYVRTEITDRFRGHDLFRWIRDERWEEYAMERPAPVTTSGKPRWEQAKEEGERQHLRAFIRNFEGTRPVITERPAKPPTSGQRNPPPLGNVGEVMAGMLSRQDPTGGHAA